MIGKAGPMGQDVSLAKETNQQVVVICDRQVVGVCSFHDLSCIVKAVLRSDRDWIAYHEILEKHCTLLGAGDAKDLPAATMRPAI